MSPSSISAESKAKQIKKKYGKKCNSNRKRILKSACTVLTRELSKRKMVWWETYSGQLLIPIDEDCFTGFHGDMESHWLRACFNHFNFSFSNILNILNQL